MKTYKIFLASSAELNDDKYHFENFISRKNKEWKRHNVFLELLTWKDFHSSISKRHTQDEYNDAIRQCDIFIALFHTRVGKYTNEEFDVAHNQFEKSKTDKPYIYTYFKTGEVDRCHDIRIFAQKIDGLDHFYSLYDNQSSLENDFNHQLDLLVKKDIIKFDTFDWKKNIRYLVFVLLIPALLLGLIYNYLRLSKSFDMTVTLNEIESIPNLPFEYGELTLYYGEKTSVLKIEQEAFFKEIPSSLRGERAKLVFKSLGYETIDTIFKLDDIAIELPIVRDNSLNKIYGTVNDENGFAIPNVQVRVLDIVYYTNAYGVFELYIPLNKQKKHQRIYVTKKGYQVYDKIMPVFIDVESKIILRK